MSFIDKFKNMLGPKEDQEFEEHLIGCDRCGIEYPHSAVTTHEAQMFCTNCLEMHKKDKAEQEFKQKQARLNVKVKYYCYDCKFHFSRKKEFFIKMCPNCSSENFVPENQLI